MSYRVYPAVPTGQSWPRLRLPFATEEEWTERGPRTPVPESLAQTWCREEGLSFVYLGDDDAAAHPGEVLSRFDWPASPADHGDG